MFFLETKKVIEYEKQNNLRIITKSRYNAFTPPIYIL